jgi:hypothetical protein
MKLKPQIIKVHLNSSKYQEPIIINQYNRNIPFIFEVFNQDGTPAVINSNDIIKIEMALGNIAIIKSTGFTIDGNKVSWALDREISLNSGNGTFNFIIEDSNNTRVSSSKIDIKIENNSIDENTQSSTFLITVMEKLQGLITNASKIYTEANLANYVRKEVGKGLSSNDYTSLEKAEVAKVKDKLDKASLLDLTYPVGSIYMSASNVNPSNLFGGTWEEFAKGKTLIGVDTSQTEFNTVEKTGGSKTHKLTIDEMPIHTPKWNGYSAGSLYTGSGTSVTHALFGNDTWNGSKANGIQPVGGDQPHNNLQPYITCYMWKRIK